ncbi:MAG: hypothetical protein JST80_08040 [Bdellovibrionales bacterium]|nr:hypothetical protein [Bdellovibrionales bacterium]
MVFLALVMFLTDSVHAAKKIEVPPCPENTQRVFHPSSNQPLWTGCVDKAGLYQGLLIQFSNQTEIIRIANVKNSRRNGKEIRAGAVGTYEERHYSDGHLQGVSFLFKNTAQLHQLLPKPLTAADWLAFRQYGDQSLFKTWTKTEPYSMITYDNGRLARFQATRTVENKKTHKDEIVSTDWHFRVAPDGRTMAIDHPEMKKLFFVDPEVLWHLSPADLKNALVPGFGSCKQYDGPIGRFGRHYDHLLYKRESSETKHVAKLKEIQNRFFEFCVPADIRENMGTLECPPQMPSPRAPTLCTLPLSDQVKIPYQPKFFKFEFTLKKPPGEFQKLLEDHGLIKFISDYDRVTETLDLGGHNKNEDKIMVKKTARGVRWKPYNVNATKKLDDEKDWWDWQGIPGY